MTLDGIRNYCNLSFSIFFFHFLTLIMHCIISKGWQVVDTSIDVSINFCTLPYNIAYSFFVGLIFLRLSINLNQSESIFWIIENQYPSTFAPCHILHIHFLCLHFPLICVHSSSVNGLDCLKNCMGPQFGNSSSFDGPINFCPLHCSLFQFSLDLNLGNSNVKVYVSLIVYVL